MKLVSSETRHKCNSLHDKHFLQAKLVSFEKRLKLKNRFIKKSLQLKLVEIETRFNSTSFHMKSFTINSFQVKLVTSVIRCMINFLQAKLVSF